jgi:hypothetical protein
VVVDLADLFGGYHSLDLGSVETFVVAWIRDRKHRRSSGGVATAHK